jgi:hypothetical protein
MEHDGDVLRLTQRGLKFTYILFFQRLRF